MNWRSVVNSLWLQYFVLSLVVMSPLLLPGYILTLDLVFTPNIPWPKELSNTYTFEALLHLLSLIVPSEAIEKLILIAVLVLSGVGAHKLTKFLAGHINRQFIYWGAYFAGIFYMINPFVYSRFMAGQYLVLLGYALTPFFVMALLKLFESPGWQNALRVAVWATLIVGVSLHHAGILLLLALAVGTAFVIKNRKSLKRLVISSGLAVAFVLIANAYWLVPTAMGLTGISSATSGFDDTQHQAFATNTNGGLGALGNTIRLQGFWADAQGMYVLPQQKVPAWGLVFLAVWILVILGLVWSWRTKRTTVLALGLAGLAAILLATTPIIAALSPYVPFVSGYREPQKFIAILALVYATVGGLGVARALMWATKKWSANIITVFVCAALVLPIICTPTMLWGFAGQLVPRQYPQDWHATNNILNVDTSATKVLFLPWHQYMSFGFSGRTIANPATKFFDKPTVVGDNPEFKGISPTVPNALNRRIEQEVLTAGLNTTSLGERLSSLGFSHVILAKAYDYQNYTYLDSQKDLQLVQDTTNLRLYAVKRSDNG